MGKIKDFLIKYEFKLALVGGFILVALISFETGYLEGEKIQGKPIVIEKPVECANTTQESMPVASVMAEPAKVAGAKNTVQDCAFVGSRNSNKVHIPTCSFAKRIKSENMVCFKSLEDAINHGRLADGCIK